LSSSEADQPSFEALHSQESERRPERSPHLPLRGQHAHEQKLDQPAH
jgi:hypothetical protein